MLSGNGSMDPKSDSVKTVVPGFVHSQSDLKARLALCCIEVIWAEGLQIEYRVS